MLSINSILGTQAGDRLSGTAQQDVIIGDAGNDIVTSSGGGDTIDGGEGFDSLDYRSSTRGVKIDLTAATATFADGSYDQLANVELFHGSNGSADTFVGDDGDNFFQAWAGNDEAFGGAGNDQLDGGAGDDILDGGDGADLLVGGIGNDTLIGGAGNDHLKGGAGRDVLIGGEDRDTADYSASLGAVTINLASGTGAGADADGDTLIDIEVVLGSMVGDDRLTGSDGDDRLYGLGGADTLMGGAGSDELTGGTGNDRIIGGAGVDFARFSGNFADYAIVNNGDGSITVTDRVANRDGSDIVFGDVENLRFADVTVLTGDYNGAFNQTINGTGLSDRIIGGRGIDVMSGGSGNDVLVGSPGADTLNGGVGSDTADYRNSTAAVTVNLSTGTGSGGTAQGDKLISIENVHGSAFADVITGNSASNWLTGNAGNDTLDGGAGNDILIGGQGGDTLKGGSGIDTASYETSSAAVTVNLATGIGAGGDAQDDRLSSIERLIGSAFADRLTGSSAAELFAGRGGDDLIAAGGGNDVVYGEDGNDTIFGGDGNDTLIGDTGNDAIYGEAGDDVMHGGDGADLFDGGAGFDSVIYSQSKAGIGIDLTTGIGRGGDADGDKLISIESVVGSAFGDTILGGTAAERLYGNDGDDLIDGGSGNDTLSGGGGRDVLRGGTGDDVIGGDDGDDDLSGGDGADTLRGGSGADMIAGGAGNDNASGDEGNDRIEGGDGNDLLDGGEGDDVLVGGAGDDGLEGGAGSDILNGGSGVDWADYRRSAEGVVVSLATGTGRGGDAEGDQLIDVERVLGSAFADTLTSGDLGDFLVGNAGDDVLIGNGGKDQLEGGDGNDIIYGGDDGDFIDGGQGADLIYGGAGSDNILGGYGADRIFGEDGFDLVNYSNSPWAVRVDLTAGKGQGGWAEGDTYSSIEQIYGSLYFSDVFTGGAAGEKLYGFGGNDQIYGLAGNDWLYGGNGQDILNGGDGADQLFGDAGNDTLAGGDGADKLTGGDGDDVLNGGLGADVLDGEAGTDLADYSDSAAAVIVDLAAGTGVGGSAQGDVLRNIENITGSRFDDILTGSDLANTIRTGAGSDTIKAGAGNDIIEGGANADLIDGGTGIDRAVYTGSSAVVIDLATGKADGGDATGDVLISIENLTGSNGDDQLFGNDVANDLIGGRGNDLLAGAAGNDALEGGIGNDMLDGGSGTDTARFSAAAADYDIALVNGLHVVTDTRWIANTDGVDTLRSVEIASFADRSFALADLTLGTSGHDVITASAGADIVFANAGDDRILAGAGNDIVNAGDGDDEVFAGEGNDQVNAGRGDDVVAGDAGDDLIRAGSGADIVGGGSGNDVISGDSGDDILSGDDGSDRLDGGSGNDVLKGGDGSDVIYGDNDSNLVRNGGFESVSADALLVETGLLRVEALDGWSSLNGAYFELIKGGNRGAQPSEGSYALDMSETMQRMEIMQQIGGLTAGDKLQLSFDAGTRAAGTRMEVYWGGELLDTIAPTSLDAKRYVFEVVAGSGDGRDALVFREVGSNAELGVTLDNVALYAIGNDVLDGGAGNDTLFAGAGDDALTGGSGNDLIDGGGGNDTAYYSGQWRDYRITQLSDGSYQIADQRSGSLDGTDTLLNVEAVQFADVVLSAGELLQYAPIDIALSSTTIAENAMGGTIIGKLSTVDINVADAFTYQLLSGTDRFVLNGDLLTVKTGASLNYEAATYHNISVRVTDAGGNSYTETMRINVADVNEAPTMLALNGGTVVENASPGTIIGKLSAIDVDGGDSQIYSIVKGGDSFAIDGANLIVAKGAALDYEEARSHEITVRVTDRGGLFTEQTFVVAVANQSGAFVGTRGNDIIIGTSEEDVIRGGKGSDIMTGGMSGDRFVWSSDDIEGGAFDIITDFDKADILDFSSLTAKDGSRLDPIRDVLVTETKLGMLVSVSLGDDVVDIVQLNGFTSMTPQELVDQFLLL